MKAEGDLGTSRASIQAAHETDKLLINEDEANQVNEETQKRLLAARKLSLVVDLDQTVIHAAVEPTIGEWQRDPTNPNYEAVKDVGSFQLKDDGPGQRGCTYYIKSRPGLQKFLEAAAQKYEMHIYTMGTRAYAEQVAKLIDPSGRFFESRILSRDESGSMIAKNLTRIFPVDTKMVVIIDDRADVWKWSPNLLRVTAFDFFVGIGDINAGFLPKKQELPPLPPPAAPEVAVPIVSNGGNNEEDDDGTVTGDEQAGSLDTSALQAVVAMSSPDSAALQDLQKKAQEEDINLQIESKPLAKLQQELDEKDGVDLASAPSPTSTSDTTTATDSTMSPTSPETAATTPEPPALPEPPKSPSRVRHSVLKNDDDELIYLEKSLDAVHQKFFVEYERKNHTPKGGRVSALTGKRKMPLPNLEEEDSTVKKIIPDVKKIIPSMKEKVLSGVTIVFTGVLPLGTDIYHADISLWAQSFGARIAERIDSTVTHVIAARVGTAKVKSAVKRGIKVVSIEWLIKSIQRWWRQDEWKYLLPGIGQKDETEQHFSLEEESEMASLRVVDSYLLSSEDESELEPADAVDDLTGESEARGRKRLKLDLGNLKYTPPSTSGQKNEGSTRAEDQMEDGAGAGEIAPASPDLSKDEWNEIDEELKEFMGSDFEDSEASDAESVRSDTSLTVRGKRKRAGDERDQPKPDGDNEDDSSRKVNGIDSISRPGKRGSGNVKPSTSSGLRAVSRAESTGGSSSSNTPTPGNNSNNNTNTNTNANAIPNAKLNTRETKTAGKDDREAEAEEREGEGEELGPELKRQKTQAEYDADLALELEAALEEE